MTHTLIRDRPATYSTLEHMVVASTEAVRPPERLTVTEAAIRYVRIKEKSYSGPWSAEKTPYLVEPQNLLTSLNFTGMSFVGPARTGKALPLNTVIPTPTGWSTMGALVVGDRLFGPNGAECSVVAVTDTMTNHDCYRVTFDDGTSIDADAGHKWLVEDIWGSPKVLTTEALLDSYHVSLKSGRSRCRYAIAMTEPLDCVPAMLPIDPYTLGVWLGDGSNHTGRITLNVPDEPFIREHMERGGSQVALDPVTRNSCRNAIVHDATGRSLYLLNRDSDLGSQGAGKHIPVEYLRGSIAQRRELLRGLMDTDGSVDGRQPKVEYTTSDEPLMRGVRELLWSLGIKHTCNARFPKFKYKGDRRTGKLSYRIAFTTYNPEDIFSLPRQIAKLYRGMPAKPKPTQINRRWIRDITPIETVPVRCIQVDASDSLFLAGEQMVPTHNSQMWLNWLAHSAICDPADMMLLHMSQGRAREFSLSDLAKMFRNSPDVRAKLVPGRQNDNVYDKTFLSGMRATIIHPSINELSGKTSGRNWSMDYDRLPDDIDGEGDAWTQLKKRGDTLGRYAMTVAESSPGRPVTDAQWMAQSPHEAPPCDGILSIYNTGDRRRWYWCCYACNWKFEPDFHLLKYPQSADPMESAEQVTLPCPGCQHPMVPDDQYELNLSGKWIKEGEFWLPDGTVAGTPRRAEIASFWMKGPAAAFTTWGGLVLKRLEAEQNFERTGSETKLKTTITLDGGLPYTPKALEAGRLPEELKNRAEAYNSRGVVPLALKDGGFLITTIDVQAGGRPAFVCHTFGIAPVKLAGGAWAVDIYHVDMWKITKSERFDEHDERKLIDPASYPEDWQLLIPQVIEKSYELGDGSGRRMAVKLVACDSGGAPSATAARLNAALATDGPVMSTTSNAYQFWRFLKTIDGRGYHERFHLLKGEPSNTASPLHVTFPDSQQKDRHAIARGDVPVWAVNSNVVKDTAFNMLGRTDPGAQVHFPVWYLPNGEVEEINWLYSQLTTEVRLQQGWKNPSRRKNEAFDLLAYCVAFLKHPSIRAEHIQWASPPGWAAPSDRNDMVFSPVKGLPFGEKREPAAKRSLADIAKNLG